MEHKYSFKSKNYWGLKKYDTYKVTLKLRHALLALIFLGPIQAFSQEIAIKTNALYDVIGTLNVGGEMRCNDNTSMQLTLNYNPWSFGENKKMKCFIVQPEYRYWLDETFVGSFFGLQAHYAKYDFSKMTPIHTLKNNRYKGNLFGCGVTYGYQWALSTFWNIEASISVGYARINYKKYTPDEKNQLLKDSHADYFGPTQLGLSFVYFIR